MSIEFFLDNAYFTTVGNRGPFKENTGIQNWAKHGVSLGFKWYYAARGESESKYVLTPQKIVQAKNNTVLGLVGIAGLYVLGSALKVKKWATLASLGVLVFNIAPGAYVWAKVEAANR